MRERIKEIIEREGMAQSQFADFIGVNRPTLSHILLGRNNPSMEVVMKIHQKFPKINILWLLDGIGSYESDAVADYPAGTLLEDQMANISSESFTAPSGYDEQATPAASGSQPQSRFYQGELFAENAVFAAESAGAPKNRKEMSLQTPPKAPYLSDSQIEYAKKSLQRKIVEIKVFYDDGTYETFKA
ncbi:MAG: helix-turn-helix transcriptional regulator [Bacteroidaceae bacterium]|nr:helix-turn-helix transcriptional regulator [Bacteroidaceae bacterium]